MSSDERERRFFRRSLLPANYEYLTAGITAGITSTLLLHPLDLLKIRFAVNDGRISSRPQYHSIKNALQTIKREEGYRGFYRGVLANCLNAGTSWGLYFFFYNSIKDYILDGTTQATLSSLEHMLAASQAGMFTLLLTNPISMVKTRMCLQYSDHYMSIPTYRRYGGMVEAFQKVYKYEGVGGLYKGLVPGLFNVSQGAIQFMIYEKIKEEYTERTGNKRMSTFQYLCAAAVSKLVSAATTYPLQLCRARLQDQHQEYTGLIEVIKTTMKCEGVRGFYKGLCTYSIHVLPNICIVFAIYEELIPSSE